MKKIVCLLVEEVVCKTKFAQVKSVMTMSNKVRIPFAISTGHHEDSKNDVERTCICSCKTWNPTSLAMEAK